MSYAEAKYIVSQVEAEIDARAGFTHRKLFTSNSNFVVPDSITKLCISACAAGGAPEAGEFILNEEFSVTPGQSIGIIVGAGNTVIVQLRTLIAASMNYSLPNNKLGFMHGFNGGQCVDAFGNLNFYGGFGGAFGYGGGAATVSREYDKGGASGAGIGGNGIPNNSNKEGSNMEKVISKTNTGGIGCVNIYSNTNARGVITNPSVGGNAGAGSLYGGGGGCITGYGGSAGGVRRRGRMQVHTWFRRIRLKRQGIRWNGAYRMVTSDSQVAVYFNIKKVITWKNGIST